MKSEIQRWPEYWQKKEIFSRLGYDPYPLQKPVHESQADVIQLVGAEGGGKSYVTAKEIAARIPWCKLIYLIGQEYENTIQEFAYLAEDCIALGIAEEKNISRPKNPPWSILTATGCEIKNVSVTKKGASGIIARGEEPDMFVLTEAGKIESEQVFTACLRRATRSKGMVLLAGTLADDSGWYARLEDDLKVEGNPYNGETFSVPAWANLSRYPGGENDEAILYLKGILPPEEFSRTIAARKMTSLAAIFGGVFNPDVHVRYCPFEEGLPVILAIDPGWFPSAYAVSVIQVHGDEVWVIDEIYEHRKIHKEIIEMCKERPWWVAVRQLVGDVAMRQHQGDRSAQEVWTEETGLPFRSERVRIQDGIDRHRSMLHQNRLFIDESCEKHQMEYKMWRKRVDKDGNPVSEEPQDQDNHLMKGLNYFLVGQFGLADRKPKKRQRVPDPWQKAMALNG